MLRQPLLADNAEEKKLAESPSHSSSSKINRSLLMVTNDEFNEPTVVSPKRKSKTERVSHTELDLFTVVPPVESVQVAVGANEHVVDLDIPLFEDPLLAAARKTLDNHIAACVVIGGAVGTGFLFLVNQAINESLKNMSVGGAMATEFVATACTVGASVGLGYLVGRKWGMFAVEKELNVAAKEESRLKAMQPAAGAQPSYRSS